MRESKRKLYYTEYFTSTPLSASKHKARSEYAVLDTPDRDRVFRDFPGCLLRVHLGGGHDKCVLNLRDGHDHVRVFAVLLGCDSERAFDVRDRFCSFFDENIEINPIELPETEAELCESGQARF